MVYFIFREIWAYFTFFAIFYDLILQFFFLNQLLKTEKRTSLFSLETAPVLSFEKDCFLFIENSKNGFEDFMFWIFFKTNYKVYCYHEFQKNVAPLRSSSAASSSSKHHKFLLRTIFLIKWSFYVFFLEYKCKNMKLFQIFCQI